MSDESTMESRDLNWLKVVLAIIVLIIVILLIWIGYERFTAGVWPELGLGTKTLWDWMDLLIVPAVITIGAFGLNESTRQRERKAEEQTRQARERKAVETHQQEIQRNRNIALNEFRKNLLANLTRAYLKAKKARRILDGNIEIKKDNTWEISRKVYETQIIVIIDAQLEFEFYHDQLEAIPQIFSDKSTRDHLVDLTHQVEHNLNEIIGEYKEQNPSTDPLKYDTLKELKDFIDRDTFKIKISNPFHECIGIIQREILNI